jgi:hypothetical protein
MKSDEDFIAAFNEYSKLQRERMIKMFEERLKKLIEKLTEKESNKS